jgi:GNAT superfamily N-acetyltransferase
MTAAHPGAPAAGPAVIRAQPESTAVLSQVIADAFHDLDVSRWLLPVPAIRRRVFPAYFQLAVEHAMTRGVVYTTPGLTAVALWLPVAGELPPPPDGYAGRLTALTAPWTGQFRLLDTALEHHHPTGQPHHYLAILAVRPDQQRRGTGTALLAAHHAVLDACAMPAYLEASDAGTRDLYLRHGYQLRPGAPIRLPDGPCMWPMWREPQPPAGPGHGQEQR